MNFHDPTGKKLCRIWLPGVGWTLLDDQFAPAVEEFFDTANELGVHDLAINGANSAFRTDAQVADMRADPAKYGAVVPPAEFTLHSAGFAIDVNYRHRSAQEQQAIVQAAANAGLTWGNTLPKKDNVHFFQDPTGGDLKARKALIRQAQSEASGGNLCGCK